MNHILAVEWKVINYSLTFHLINRLHAAVCLFSNGSQMTSKCGMNKQVVNKAQTHMSLMFLPHFDIMLLTATWNLLVLFNKDAIFLKKKHQLCVCPPLDQTLIKTNQNSCIFLLIWICTFKPFFQWTYYKLDVILSGLQWNLSK